MKPKSHSIKCTVVAAIGWLMAVPVFAQPAEDTDQLVGNPEAVTQVEAADADSEDSSTKKGAGTGSSEVEHNEENYRRFMELRERDPRTSTMPTNTFEPGTQKLDVLPESSQKHLRNQLREVIVEEGEWQEGDENKRYAYVPSPAAESDRELQLQEAEAWDELVDKYQEREAQIHANSARSEAARQAGEAAGSAGGSSEGSQSDNQNGGQQGSSGQNPGSQGQNDKSGQAAQQAQQQSSESKNNQNIDSAAASSEARRAEARNAGVSENALEFLTRAQGNQPQGNQRRRSQTANGQGTEDKGQSRPRADGQSSTQSMAQTEQGQQGQEGQQFQQEQEGQEGQEGQQSQQEQQSSQTQPTVTHQSNQPSAQRSEEGSSNEGASENALQFLTGSQQGGTQGQQQSDEQTVQQESAPTGDENTQQADEMSQQQADDFADSSEAAESSEASQSTDGDAENTIVNSEDVDRSETAKEPVPVTESMPVYEAEDLSDAGTTQNAFEALSRGTQPSPPADTLSIEDLMNAQGISTQEIPDGSKRNDEKEGPD